MRARVPSAMVKLSRPQIHGSMNAAYTHRILRMGMRCVRGRYQRGLKRNPALHGSLMVCLDVNHNGAVIDVNIKRDTLGDVMLAVQIKACLRRLRFPGPQGGGVAKVCVPFLLQFRK